MIFYLFLFLQTNEAPKVEAADDDLKKDSYGEFYHKPAENIRDKLEVFFN